MKNKTLIIVLVVVGLVLLCCVGSVVTIFLAARGSAQWASDILPDIIREQIESDKDGADAESDKPGTDSKVTIGDTTVEQKFQETWPADAPSDIPKFTSGKIKSVVRTTIANQKSWVLTIEKVAKTDISAYAATLKSTGWEVFTTEGTEGITVVASIDKYVVTLGMDSTSTDTVLGINYKIQD